MSSTALVLERSNSMADRIDLAKRPQLMAWLGSIYGKIERGLAGAAIVISLVTLSYTKASFDREGKYAGELTMNSSDNLEKPIAYCQRVELEFKNYSKNTTTIQTTVYSE